MGYIVAFVIIGIVIYLASTWEPGRSFYYNKVKYHTPINRQDYLAIDKILSKHLSYYNALTENGRAKFINRLIVFQRTKKFVGRDGQVITPEVKTLISAAAVQLTYGLERFELSHFHTIHVFPDVHYSELIRAHVKGLTTGAGVILLSWKYFTYGYAIDDDKYNLGLHEMAHALKIDVMKGDDFDRRFAAHLDKWLHTSSKEFKRIQQGESSFLRKYGGTNMHEFFAVCIEHFFEAPEQFSRELPAVFKHLCVLLNQNPLHTNNDYQLQRNTNDPLRAKLVKKEKSKRKPSSVHWSYIVLALGPVAAIPAWIGYTNSVEIEGESLQWMYTSFVVVGALLAFYFVRRKVLHGGIAVGFVLAGFAPTAVVLALGLNHLIPIDKRQETFEVTEVYLDPYEDKAFVVLEAHQYNWERKLRTVDMEYYRSLPFTPTQYRLTFSTGVFGIEVLYDKELLP